jgi:hypothetical protein
MGLISASGTVSGVAQGTVQVNGDFANICLHQRLVHLAEEVTRRVGTQLGSAISGGPARLTHHRKVLRLLGFAR